MHNPASPSQNGGRTFWFSLKNVTLETAAVAVLGAVVGIVANKVSPRGLDLTRDHFPRPLVIPTMRAAGTGAASVTNAAADGGLADRLHGEGFQLANHEQVLQLFNDPRYRQELVVFVDAREEAAYRGGHIPGAYQLDRYYPDKYVSTMLRVCMPAQQVVVYCNGGNCEDSEFAAVMLSEWGVPKTNLWVYAGGITEWTNNRHPVEVGDRLSGNLHP